MELTTDKINQILIQENYGNDVDFIATENDYRDEVENGIPFIISKFGVNDFDKHMPFKSSHLILNIGHTNVGKTQTGLWMLILLAKFSKRKFLIYSAENRISALVKRIIIFYFGIPFEKLTKQQKDEGFGWVKIHFMFVLHLRMYTYKQIIKMATVAMDKGFEFDGMMIDPYNSLKIELKGLQKHDYNIQALEELRIFTEMTKRTILMNCHTTTEAQRMIDKDGNSPRPLYTFVEGGAPFANKADDVWVTHRHVRDADRFMITELYVDKIREQEYGGQLTPWNQPIKMKFKRDRTGYEMESSPADQVRSQQESYPIRPLTRIIPGKQTFPQAPDPNEGDQEEIIFKFD